VAGSGWYRDPSGAQGRYRYWDGSAWSAVTTTDPLSSPAPEDGGRAYRKQGGKSWIVALVALAIVVVAAVVFVLRGTGGAGPGGRAAEDTDSSYPTVSAWNEVSPSPSSAPSTIPVTVPAGEGPQFPCLPSTGVGDTAQPDGKMAADTLQIDRIADWYKFTPEPPFRSPVAYDSHMQATVALPLGSPAVGPMAESSVWLALLAKADGFTDLQTSAEQVMQCGTSDAITRASLIDSATQVSGHPAWRVQSQISSDGMPGLANWQGYICDVIVVDLGDGQDHLGVYLAIDVIGNDAVHAQIDQNLTTLVVV